MDDEPIDMRCEAPPGGIREPILVNEANHRTTYPGCNELTLEPKTSSRLSRRA